MKQPTLKTNVTAGSWNSLRNVRQIAPLQHHHINCLTNVFNL